jgi:hypothetical protein
VDWVETRRKAIIFGLVAVFVTGIVLVGSETAASVAI